MSDLLLENYYNNRKDLSDFEKQISIPYESTKQFFDFINKKVKLDNTKNLIDACCGCGPASFYVIKHFEIKQIYAFDITKNLLDIGKRVYSDLYRGDSGDRIIFKREDIFKLSNKALNFEADGIICLQSLLMLNDWKSVLTSIAKTKTKWLAFSSLFYDGNIEAYMSIKSYNERNQIESEFPYNIYSKQIFSKYLKGLGYKDIHWNDFNIGMELIQKDINKVGTYTKKLVDGNYLQFSGPVHLPWSFLFASR
tara:strand:- start:2122 stop:2877 length:756 start_codon:yes stop_codon:yes gene_type:complete